MGSYKGSGNSISSDIIGHWASKPLPDWKREGKISAPRICLAKLSSGIDIEEVNRYLLDVRPWSRPGSTWLFHRGDYDFTMVPIVSILHLFGGEEEILFEGKRQHILGELIPKKEVRDLPKVPRTLGLIPETENHILMIESSRYLRDLYLVRAGSMDPDEMKASYSPLSDFLRSRKKVGMREFNSIPYCGYSLSAICNLQAFGENDIKKEAKELLDDLNMRYAVGSLGFRRYPPFNRRTDRVKNRSLTGDPHTAMMMVWASKTGIEKIPQVRSDLHHSLMAAVVPYALPETVIEGLKGRIDFGTYFFGHGRRMTPEIYSRGPGFLLTGGGVKVSRLTFNVIRPTTLLLDDGMEELLEVVHVRGPGDHWRDWNNTGIWHGFAVSGGKVHVPDHWSPDEITGYWSLFRRGNLVIAVYSAENLGIIYIPESPKGSGRVLFEIISLNKDPSLLEHRFRTLSGDIIEYDTLSGRKKMVIRSFNGKAFDRIADMLPPASFVPVTK